MSSAMRICVATLALLFSTATGYAGDADESPTFDVGIEMTGATDYMDTGLTNSNHKPSAGMTITPTYGIFYGTIYGANIDYGDAQPWLETKFAIGATPTFGKLSIDFNLARRIKFDDPSEDRWVPYVTGTYAASDRLSLSLGAGYYAYDARATADYWELYGAGTVTLSNSSYFTGEIYWEPNVDGAGNDYSAVYGTVGIPFMDSKFEAIATVGYEAYQDNAATPSYLWSQIGVKYNFTDNINVFVGYHSNNLSGQDCPLQAYTDCDAALLAKFTYTMKLSDLFATKTK